MIPNNLNMQEENQQITKELKIAEMKVRLIMDFLENGSDTFTGLQKEYINYFNESDVGCKKPEADSVHLKFLEVLDNFKTLYSKNLKDYRISLRKIEELTVRLNESERIKSEFLANTSHEFRTPLNAIMGFLELIKEGLYDTPQEMNDFVEGALKSSQNLLRLLSNFIDIARAESKKIKINFEEVNLKTLLEEIYLSHHIKAVTKGINFVMELPEENLLVRGDRDKIKQIFDNLLSNAFKFTTTKGEIKLAARETRSLNHILCEITDNGIGIASENRMKIFDRFYQVDGSSTREFGGSGIGLPLSRSYVELMGGFIGVYSEGKDKGSRFYFTLPVYHSDDEFDLNSSMTETAVNLHGDTNDPLILIVEDDFNYRKYLSELLVKNGYSTIGASTADDALSRLKEFNPKLVILDLALPRRNYSDLHHGLDLYKLLKNQPEYKHIPVIIISGHGDDLIKMFHEDLTIEWDHFFEKPFDQNILIRKINLLISGFYFERKNIILIENDPKICEIINKALPSREYHLKTFTNGNDFLKFVRSSTYKIDLLAMNQLTAILNCSEIYDTLSAKYTEFSLPVIIITLSDEFKCDEKINILTKGNLDQIQKTELIADPDRLLSKIKTFFK